MSFRFSFNTHPHPLNYSFTSDIIMIFAVILFIYNIQHIFIQLSPQTVRPLCVSANVSTLFTSTFNMLFVFASIQTFRLCRHCYPALFLCLYTSSINRIKLLLLWVILFNEMQTQFSFGSFGFDCCVEDVCSLLFCYLAVKAVSSGQRHGQV